MNLVDRQMIERSLHTLNRLRLISTGELHDLMMTLNKVNNREIQERALEVSQDFGDRPLEIPARLS